MSSRSAKFASFFMKLLLPVTALILLAVLLEILFSIMGYGEKKVTDTGWFKKHVTYNSLGYRDHEHYLEKPKDIFRILVLGDSMTFGQGVNNLKDIIPKKLETYLNQTSSKTRFEVISFAHPGYNTDSELYDLYTYGFKFQPDMVFLAYYHNDIPRPSFIKCDASERKLVTEAGILKDILNQSALYKTVNFRVNRLLEKLQIKPTMVDCINRTYKSIGWEMEKVYLDAIRIACRFRGIKLMMGVIPLIYKLDDKYPISIVHSKFSDYCKKNGVSCIDFFENGLKGLNAKDLIFSDHDRHLNANGAEIVAKILYKKLQPLTDFNHLSNFHRAFSLRELLEENITSKRVDDNFIKIINNEPTLTFHSPPFDEKNTYSFKAKKSLETYVFTKTIFDSSKENTIAISQYSLDQNGQLIDHTFSSYDSQSHKVSAIDRVEPKNGLILFTHIMIHPDGQKEARKIHYKFIGENYPDKSRRLFIEEGISFRDPKVLLTKLLAIPHNLESDKYEETIVTQFLFFYRYSWDGFIDALFYEIIKQNPNPMILRAIAKTYKQTNNLKKLDEMVQAYPQYKKILMG